MSHCPSSRGVAAATVSEEMSQFPEKMVKASASAAKEGAKPACFDLMSDYPGCWCCYLCSVSMLSMVVLLWLLQGMLWTSQRGTTAGEGSARIALLSATIAAAAPTPTPEQPAEEPTAERSAATNEAAAKKKLTNPCRPAHIRI